VSKCYLSRTSSSVSEGKDVFGDGNIEVEVRMFSGGGNLKEASGQWAVGLEYYDRLFDVSLGDSRRRDTY
jgi:hypothetical protein